MRGLGRGSREQEGPAAPESALEGTAQPERQSFTQTPGHQRQAARLLAMHKISSQFCSTNPECRAKKLKASPNALRIKVKTRTEHNSKSEVLSSVHT